MSTKQPAGRGTRHDILVAAGAQERLYELTITIRTTARDEQEARETRPTSDLAAIGHASASASSRVKASYAQPPDAIDRSFIML